LQKRNKDGYLWKLQSSQEAAVMKLQDAVKPFVSRIVGQTLLDSQAEALAIFVASALTLTRSILTDLAVEIKKQGYAKTTKSALKRLDRWINNPRIDVGKAMRPVVARWLKKRKKKLVVSFDWVNIRSYKTLVAAANIKGRCVWLLWKSVPVSGLNLNMSRIEQDVLFELRQMLPRRLKTIILADRGFHKSQLFGYCQRMGFDYVIRIKPEYHVAAGRFSGSLDTLPVKPGTRRFWKHAICGKKPKVKQNVVIYYQKHLPEKRDEPWFLATSLCGTARQIVVLYGRRMGIEQSFRDKKNVNNGWGLRHMRVHTAGALDHLLLILAIAYLILCGLGLLALRLANPREWCSNNRTGECGVFTIARRMLDQLQVTVEQIFEEIAQCSKSYSPKWG
jgi:hypothetical protein